ncbi:iron complex transport system substrate-binding protein [Kushneria sinocarnis]|uniref:Iron complex transport system substrate-binding protein n=1 Tax=Kushneria sinocarnis TaxID=595502 RepID=A0A420WYX5_9GAMM|nr:iron-siderophore ABC transporter substrate-binding protein [Kushneria sinocarnis]RKR06548.1 iron complex transport system substrate-binding protein [Kushneria sinocarnis]
MTSASPRPAATRRPTAESAFHPLSSRHRSWRLPLVLLLVLCSLALTPVQADDTQPTPALISLDWSMTETLLAIGVTPLGVAAPESYARWVGAPAIPAGVHDIGLRDQPNLELLARLDPDGIVTVSFLAGDSRLSRIAPVHAFDIYTSSRDPWQRALKVTRQLGRLTHHEQGAERLITRVRQQLAGARRKTRSDQPPVAVLQFIDNRHVRIYGEGSLFQAVFDQIGLTNAWQGDVNNWGFRQLGIDELARLPADTRLLVIRPLPTTVNGQLEDNILWQHLPAVRRGRVHELAPVWSFGGLASMARFAGEVAQALPATEGATP